MQTSDAAIPAQSSQQRVIVLQWVTMGWMLVECSVALTAAWHAKSVSLLAFGSDSFVELISAAVVLLQFVSFWRMTQTQAARVCGLLLYGLAVVVGGVAIAGLFWRVQPDNSLLGMAITAGALLLMPVLARLKRDEAARSGNKALRADAVQSATCAYLAALTLGGLLLRSFFGVSWLDQVAALAAIPILIVEARRARQGHTCACC